MTYNELVLVFWQADFFCQQDYKKQETWTLTDSVTECTVIISYTTEKKTRQPMQV